MPDVRQDLGVNDARETVGASVEPIVPAGKCHRRSMAAFVGVASLVGAVVGAGVLITPRTASAIPSFARQTGQPCAACHTAFPELTPFGRRFKLGGYTMGGGLTLEQAPPIAAMMIPTFTHTQQNQDSPPPPGAHTNNNVSFQQASLFYGGQIYGNLGAFVQGTYDNFTQHVFLDNTDIRYADTTKLLGLDVLYGVSVNNSPSVQDVWNTTPAWGFPYIAATFAPQFKPPGTVIEGGLAGKVVGTGLYTFWNDMLYLDVSFYQNLSRQTLRVLGEPGITDASIGGVAPYWRAALELSQGEHSWEIGTFGLYANQLPGRIPEFGFDQYLDVGVDTQYQFIGDQNSVTIKASYIAENQTLNSTYAQQGSSNIYNRLTSFKTSVGYVYDHSYSLTVGYFDVKGSNDATLYGGSSLTNSPNGKGLIFDAAYLPFSNGGPSFYPWLNARIGVSYTRYLSLNGGVLNFDGAYHNASDNNTLLLYSWIAF